jgi:hypothetical protein
VEVGQHAVDAVQAGAGHQSDVEGRGGHDADSKAKAPCTVSSARRPVISARQ